jgi:hypothetical protein
VGGSMSSVVISGDTSGAITLSAPAVAGTNTITLPASTGTVTLTSSTQVCQAWVNYKGTTTRGINASYNVSSVTFNSTGNYTINFTNAFTDANYCAVSGVSYDLTTGSGMTVIKIASQSTTSMTILGQTNTGSAIDNALNAIAVFR